MERSGPRVLAILASPRREKAQSTALADITLKALLKANPDAKVDRLFLIDYPIRPCLGFYSDNLSDCNPRQCTTGTLHDAMAGLHQKLIWSDILVVATPTYWYGLPGHLKTFLDRCTSLENIGKLLDGKIGGVIASAQEGGAANVIQHLLLILNDMGLWIPPYGFSYAIGQDLKDDSWAIRYAQQLGENLERAWRILRDTGPWWQYPNEVA